MAADKIFTIPSGVPFARALAEELLRRAGDKPEDLTALRILLPTRRACRAAREAFLQAGGGKPLLLPRLQPLGDMDEEELALEQAGYGDAEDILRLPPAMPPLRRLILLAGVIMRADGYGHGAGHAMAMAAALARLMDRIRTENLDMAALPGLAGEEFAQHWQITLNVLKALSAEWPKILDSLGMIDAADRRNRLLLAQAEHWERHPPSTPVIAAGSTGTIPATARLLKAVAALPQGMIVLPGLDKDMDEDSWQALDETHPQAALRKLLAALETERSAVKTWPCAADGMAARRALATEIMRPAATAREWQNVTKDMIDLTGIVRCDADTPQEEANAVALLMRQALETPGRSAALVTPDRALARRVAASCARWGIRVDDSAGQALPDTPAGGFLRLCAAACLDGLAPGKLLSLLRHRLCRLATREEINALERAALRGPRPPPGIAGLALAGGDGSLLKKLEAALQPFLEMAKKPAPFLQRLDAHIAMAEKLAGGPEYLWAGEDGEAAATFLSELREHAAPLPDTNGEDYRALLEQMMAGVTVRPRWGAHPRLSILGQLEARLVRADLVILGGLNEGSWPPDPGHDPWMSRPMMARFGLPPPERSAGLAAHDFVQGFCAPEVVLTRAKRSGGAPAIPARWLQRLDTVLKAAGIEPDSLHAEGKKLLGLARALDRAPDVKSYSRPKPAPPVELRPRALSVTQVETWLRDPYGIYARHVLRLRKLDALDKQPDAADRGTVLHDVLNDFIKTCPRELPGNAENILFDLGSAALSRRTDEAGFWDFWRPRLRRIAAWAAAHEKDWRVDATPLATEADGTITLEAPGGDFILRARADRIDRRRDGTLAVIDYKSGGSYSKSKMRSGAQPQLPLEALILQQGGFGNIAPSPVTYLGYWILTGGEPAGKTEALDEPLDQAIADAEAGIAALVSLYDDPATPYYSLPDPARAPRYNDYEHLARVQEWAALDEAEAA